MEPTRRDIERIGGGGDEEAEDAPDPNATRFDVLPQSPTVQPPPRDAAVRLDDDFEISAELDPTQNSPGQSGEDAASYAGPAHLGPGQTPESVGPYRIERTLGAGGMGTVYLGRHEDTGGAAAVKVLPAALAREPGFVARFTREIEALKTLDNPYVVRLLGHGVQPHGDGSEVHFYVMEYVPGETLTERLKRDRRLDWREVVKLGAQVCSALKAAHNAGIIHRDLKPSNLMLTPEGDVKLTDFGVAKFFATSRLTVTGGVIGTAEYMSPEQAEGRRVTKQTDIYALGAVMYAMVTGRPPFTGKNVVDLAQKHRAGVFDAPKRYAPDIPQWLDDVICTCLSKKPEDRYPDAYVLQRRLEEIPKKVELALSEGTNTGGHTAATVATNREPEVGGGTFAAEMMRAELDRQAKGGPAAQLLDNTWFLIAALAAVVAFGVWMSGGREATPEELFARGERLMESDRFSDWEAARREAFVPLLELDESYAEKVRPYLDRIEVAELTRPAPRLGPRSRPTTEPQRLLRKAAGEYEAGELAAAAETVRLLQDLLVGDPKSADVLTAADRLAEQIAAAESADARADFIAGRRELAERLRGEGREEAAGAMLRALDAVYGPF